MYSPKIDQELIPILYSISKEKGKPMTKVVNEILRQAIKKEKGEINKETGEALCPRRKNTSPQKGD